ncbi:unnamed protein product [Microthlaspi erraticum]|uniref:Uncharacterized protein n=1 Tax=Microthlaspi erraticum TaxID=1685480 RepID=A0A6D2KYB0_9BRAS|nr:unnamed protein product [Microthlaspi erraticum]
MLPRHNEPKARLQASLYITSTSSPDHLASCLILIHFAFVKKRKINLSSQLQIFSQAKRIRVWRWYQEDLVTTSTWYHDYWISQHQGPDGFYDNGDSFNGGADVDVADLLPESFDFDDMEDFFDADASEFDHGQIYHAPSDFGLGKNGEMVRKSTGNRSPKSVGDPAKYAEKPAKWGNQRTAAAPRNIHQPR